jgi:hypothetical protein
MTMQALNCKTSGTNFIDIARQELLEMAARLKRCLASRSSMEGAKRSTPGVQWARYRNTRSPKCAYVRRTTSTTDKLSNRLFV